MGNLPALLCLPGKLIFIFFIALVKLSVWFKTPSYFAAIIAEKIALFSNTLSLGLYLAA